MVVALVGVLGALSYVATLPRSLDLQGARSGQLTGTVTEVGYDQRSGPPLAGKPWRLRLTLLRVDGQFLDLNLFSSWNAPWLRVGQRITVHYRRGKSGREYVDSIDPLPDAKDTP